MLDRLLHRPIVHHLDGDSYHLRTRQARNDTLRRAATGNTTPTPILTTTAATGELG